MCYRFRCKTSEVDQTISISNVSIPINRHGSIETVVLTGGFRYAVSDKNHSYITGNKSV